MTTVTKKEYVDLRKLVKTADKKGEIKKSWAWYQENVRTAADNMSRQKFLGDNITYQKKNVQIGSMVFFFYSAKHKDTLPYWDTSPLSIIFGEDSDYFYGLNLHYISPLMRAVILEKLLQYADNDKLTARTKFKMTWETLKSFSELPIIKPCVKKYLKKQVKSNFLVIPLYDAKYIVWLPLENFRNASNQQVWEDSRMLGGK